MKTIHAPGIGPVLHLGTDAQAHDAQRIINGRAEFTREYCRSKGWPESPDELSFEQIFEIRAQPGWKEPQP